MKLFWFFLNVLMENMKKTDQELIEKYLAGDEKSLEILFAPYLKMIFGFVRKYTNDGQDAEDITQETFVRAWKNLKKFDQGKNFKTWLFAIAKNAAIDHLRKKKRSIPFVELENDDERAAFSQTIIDPSPIASDIFEKKEERLALDRVLNNLSLNYRQVLYLRHNDELTFKEIARLLDEPLNTVKSWYRRALIKARKFFPDV